MTRFFPDISLTVNNIPDISLTCSKFPDISRFSRFSRQVVTLSLGLQTFSISVSNYLHCREFLFHQSFGDEQIRLLYDIVTWHFHFCCQRRLLISPKPGHQRTTTIVCKVLLAPLQHRAGKRSGKAGSSRPTTIDYLNRWRLTVAGTHTVFQNYQAQLTHSPKIVFSTTISQNYSKLKKRLVVNKI